jgi:hypothetical protein
MTERIQEEAMIHFIERFVGKYSENEEYRHVYRYEGRMYATDGHISIAFQNDPYVLADDDNYNIPKKIEELITKASAYAGAYQPMSVELPPRIRCIGCAGVGEVAKCPACDGEGVIICPTCGNETDCRECDGMGVLGPLSGKKAADMSCPLCLGRGETLVPIPLGGASFPRHYLGWLELLPGIEIALNVEPNKPMLFRFHGGYGLLAPLLPPN